MTGKAAEKQGRSLLMMAGIFVLWYTFSSSYNVYNSYMKVFYFPALVSGSQFLVGLFYAVPLWVLGIRKFPDLTWKEIIVHLGPVSFLSALGHTLAVMAMFQPGGGSFTHVIKASEPVVSVLLGLVINGTIPKPFTALTLVPIVYGVAYASTLGNLNVATMTTELKSTTAIYAMTSNVAYSLRSILRKNMKKEVKAKLDSASDHAVSTLLATVFMVVWVYFLDAPIADMLSVYNGFSPEVRNKFLFDTFIAGMSFYMYNEFQNLVLSDLGPVSMAVGNTLKRVAIFVGLYIFTAGETFPMPKVIGCAIAITGCMGYAICHSKHI